MTARLLAIPKLLIDSASYVENEKAIAAEKMIEKLAKGKNFALFMNF